MKEKLYTVPFGRFAYVAVCCLCFLLVVAGLIALPSTESLIFIIAALVLFIILIIANKISHFTDYILLDSAGVTHKGKFYSWDAVFVTAACECICVLGVRKFRLYFYDRYIDKKCDIVAVDKSGFCLDVGKYCLDRLTAYYGKEIKVYSVNNYFVTKSKNMELINTHNAKVKNSLH